MKIIELDARDDGKNDGWKEQKLILNKDLTEPKKASID
jgi:hypothetical protein